MAEPLSMNRTYLGGMYYQPLYGPWEEIFAWRPRRIAYVHSVTYDNGISDFIETHKWIWLEKIYRRRVHHGIYYPDRIREWQYATLMDMMTYGH